MRGPILEFRVEQTHHNYDGLFEVNFSNAKYNKIWQSISATEDKTWHLNDPPDDN